jgi:hypothetical protein
MPETETETMKNIKEKINEFLKIFMPITEMLEMVERMDIKVEPYHLAIYKVKNIVRIDIKDLRLDK